MLTAGAVFPGPASSELGVAGLRFVKLNGSLPPLAPKLLLPKLLEPKGSLLGAGLKLAEKLPPKGSLSPKESSLIDLEFS